MGQASCTPMLEQCYSKQPIADENKSPYPQILNKHTHLYTSNCDLNQRHLELYQQQQSDLKSYLTGTLTQSTRKHLEFQNRFLKLPSNIICHIMYFVIDNYCNLLTVNSQWYMRLNSAITKTLQCIEEGFAEQYPFLKLKSCRSGFRRFKIGKQQGFRLERSLICEVRGCENNLVRIGYQSKCKNNQQNTWYRFAILKKGESKSVWISVDQSTNSFDKETTPIIQPILPFCIGDSIKLSINILTINGLSSAIQWMPHSVEPLVKSIFNQNKHPTMLYQEPINADWTLFNYFNNPLKKCFDGFHQLKLKECRCTGIDIVVNKMIFNCQHVGKLKLYLDINIVQGATVNEVKRSGLASDLNDELQLRCDDELVFYYIR